MRKAKQGRRDARRAAKRNGEDSVDTTLRDAIRRALRGHPVGLLTMASWVIDVAKSVDRILTGFTGVRSREMTALLGVVAELLVDDPAAQLRCRRALAERGDHLPHWITALPQAEVHRAVRRTNVFGDVDELVIGMRLAGRHELTIGVEIDHNMLSSVVNAGVVPDPIDIVLARVAETSGDVDVFDMSLADARASIENALKKPTLAPETEAWPLYRVLVQWVISRLPEGGRRRSLAGDCDSKELCDKFFATDSAAPFTESGHRELLLELFDTGTGDPLRWSEARVEQAIRHVPVIEDSIPLEVALDTPDLLRAFIPYAHAQSGIRDELTARTLAMVDSLRSGYKRQVLGRAKRRCLEDAV